MALVALCFVSCDKTAEEDKPVDPENPQEEPGRITADSDAMLFGESAETLTVSITATKAWSASCDGDWVSFAPASGEAGTFTVDVSVTANEEYEPRSATLTFVCDKDKARVVIGQVQKGAMVVALEPIQVPAEGGSFDIRVNTNTIVKAEPDVDWISGAATKALEEKIFTFVAAANEAYEPRTGHIVFTSTAGEQTVTVEQAAAEKPDDPNPPTPGEGDELDCPNPPTAGNVELDKVYGYGAGVTGGEGATSANILHFDNGKALQTWLLARTKSEKKGDHSPVIIWLSGTFVPTDGRDFSEAHPWFDVKDVSNLSFYGTDGFVMDRIGIFCVRAKNIIIRNINFRQPKAENGADAVSMQECDGVWVDHCTFTSLNQTKDYEDGSTDVTHASKNVTVSWCHYVKTQKSCLVGHSNSASADAAITATFHHNWFDQSNSRHPRVRFGKVHVYNNLYDNNATYGVGSAYGARVLVEYNYFDGVRLPTDICTYPAKPSGSSMVSNLTGSVAGYLYATQDVYVNKPSNASDPYPFTNVAYTKYGGTAGTPLTYADFKPAYDYVVTAAEDVPTVVKDGAGYGKLGWKDAPVAVNNGGITEFDGSDPDDPSTPDPEDPDDPDQPGDDSAHTYTLSMQSKAVVQTKDGAAGASYFDCSTNVADFSKDYSGSFTIDGTTYTQGFKMDSKGYVNFTTSSEFTTTVQFYFARRKSSDTGAKMQLIPEGGEARVWETPYDTYGDSGVVTLEKGQAYTIKQKSSEQALILVVVKETE